MTIKLITRALALIFAVAIGAAAQSQTWTVGDQGADWSTIPSSYPTGALPVDAYEPAEAADVFTPSDWYISNDELGGNFVVGASNERKLRFTCIPSGPIITQDFILRNVSHLHGGFGLKVWNQNTGYASARAAPSSGCSGGPLLSQIYIEPQMMTVLTSGAIVGLRAQSHTVYYVEGLQSDTHVATWVRRGEKFILGANPTNYNDAARRAVYAAAALAYPGSPDTPAGFGGWQCYKGASFTTLVPVTLVKAQLRSSVFPDSPASNDTSHSRYIWGSGPTDDPWGGNCVPSGGATYAIIIGNLIGPRCSDGMNLESPDGRGHKWYAANKLDSSVRDICPKTTLGAAYAKEPEPQFKSTFTTTGPTDYKLWYLTSDRMNSSGTAADATSLDECRQTGPWFCGGSTLHADWGYGAQSDFFDKAQRECLGITVRGVAPVSNAGGAECNAGQYTRFLRLRGEGTSPNAALSAGCTTMLGCYDPIPSKPKERYITIPKTSSGTVHIMRM